MFKCQKCGKITRQYRSLITKGRKTNYTTNIVHPKKGSETKMGEGWEIVEEVGVCMECYDKHKDDEINMLPQDVIDRKNTEIKRKRR